ncbi:MAG: DUF502 domain-containing protein [Gemmatimonadetes bacterium]|nr:DUF502 domain-containing protein [Gemmatimonadota bacterium]
MNSTVRRLRRYLLVGLVVTAPVGLTVYVLVWVFNKLDAILGGPLQAWLGVRVPGLGFVLLGLSVVLVGWLVHRAVGRQLLHWWNAALVRFPLTGRIYNALSQITQSLVGAERRVFRRTVLVPYPTEGMWVVAFVTHEAPDVLSAVAGEPCVNVFVPTTPNPTSGFMLVVPRRLVRDLPLGVEDAMKLVISAGALVPGAQTVTTGRQGLDLERLLREEHR